MTRRFRSRSLWIGCVLTGLFTVAALLSYIWTPYDYEALSIPARNQTPNAAHWFGTDQYGRDILSMIMAGARTSLALSLAAVALAMTIGVPLGLAAAARRGSFVDEIIMRGNDIAFAFPAILIAALIANIMGPGAFIAIVAIALFNIPVFARVTRGGALSIWTLDFVMAARVAGKGAWRISVEHVLPNVANLLIVQATIQLSLGILAEAGLSFIGLGAQPPIPSWGRMLADARTMLTIAPHLALFPGLAITAAVFGLNLLGDGLRDWLDPKLRREGR